MVFQFIEQLQVDGELGHELMTPVPVGVALHHGDGVVLLLIAAYITGNRIGITVGIVIEVVCTVAVDHSLTVAGITVCFVA